MIKILCVAPVLVSSVGNSLAMLLVVGIAPESGLDVDVLSPKLYPSSHQDPVQPLILLIQMRTRL
ncbi:hypothetical protein U0070_018022 [Myodes glareolus]|uniref:Uncharacterized protein n=1 Tax=Myodes glareolus TaxID=447135 RepID=A0AAW0IJY2_MYOGA